jgi:hypothetical protein
MMNKRIVCLAGAIGACAGIAAVILVLNRRTVRGSGTIVSRTQTVGPFKRVCLNSSRGDVVVTQANEHSIRVEADDNLIDRLTAKVDGDTLRVNFASGFELVRPSRPIQVQVAASEIEQLQVAGQGHLKAGALRTSALELAINGKGAITAGPLAVETLTVNINGIGKCAAEGAAREQDVNISGIGQHLADGLDCQRACVAISGIGKVALRVAQALDVAISGVGDVIYHGHPEVTREISGRGKVSAAEDASAAAGSGSGAAAVPGAAVQP